MKENVILIDWIQTKKWNFEELINEYTGDKWTSIGVAANGSENNVIQKITKRYFKYFTLPFKIFLNRKKYGKVLAWQQFFGLIFAFYCNIFKVKESPKLYIMTFIYKPKKGLVGKIYFKFINYSLKSKYIENVICYSKAEVEYYSNIFEIDSSKFEYCLYATDDHDDCLSNELIEIPDKEYFLSVGRSNRDYDFLIDSVKDTSYNVTILCDKLQEKKEGNIEIYNNVFGEDYLAYLKNCFAIIIPLKDKNISSGQLVFLKAMEYGKPVIITENTTVHEYIKNEYNGLIIDKEKESLIKAMDKISNNSEYYMQISNNAKNMYNEKFSFESFAKSVANIIVRNN